MTAHKVDGTEVDTSLLLEQEPDFAVVKDLNYDCAKCGEHMKLYQLNMPSFGADSEPYRDTELVRMIEAIVENNRQLRKEIYTLIDTTYALREKLKNIQDALHLD